MPAIACLNGVFSAPEEARVPIDDRGYVFGDGVYEVLRCYNGKPRAVDRHIARLERSLGEIGIPTDCMTPLRGWVQEALQRSGIAEALIYIQVTRGVAPRLHTFGSDLKPQVLITVRPAPVIAPSVRENGVAAITHEDLRWARRDIKTINLLPNLLAKQKAHDTGAHEAILVEADGTVTEGSSTNLFGVINGVARTHPADHHILEGVTRDILLGIIPELGIPFEERALTASELQTVDELFLTGSTTEVLGIVRLDGEPVGNGAVGPITRRLYAAFEEWVRRE